MKIKKKRSFHEIDYEEDNDLSYYCFHVFYDFGGKYWNIIFSLSSTTATTTGHVIYMTKTPMSYYHFEFHSFDID